MRYNDNCRIEALKLLKVNFFREFRIEYKEKIYIEKCVGFKERIMYKAYEGDTNNA